MGVSPFFGGGAGRGGGHAPMSGAFEAVFDQRIPRVVGKAAQSKGVVLIGF
jgi:hypothetical protein